MPKQYTANISISNFHSNSKFLRVDKFEVIKQGVKTTSQFHDATFANVAYTIQKIGETNKPNHNERISHTLYVNLFAYIVICLLSTVHTRQECDCVNRKLSLNLSTRSNKSYERHFPTRSVRVVSDSYLYMRRAFLEKISNFAPLKFVAGNTSRTQLGNYGK